MPTYYYHCTDGWDLLIDRSGSPAQNRSQIRRAAQACARRVMRTLPSFGQWAGWIVSVHDEEGRLVDTIEFPATRITPGKRSRHGTEKPSSVHRHRPRTVPVHPERRHGAGGLLWRPD
jgi:hypothetical protein